MRPTAPDPPSVSIIEPVGGHGGMDYYDMGLCLGLTKAGMPVTLYTCDESSFLPDAPFRVKQTYRRIFGNAPLWLRGSRYFLGTIRTFVDGLLSRSRIYHFHFFHVGPLEMMNILLAKVLRRKVVITAHDVESFVSKLSVPVFVRLAYGMADQIIAHNRVSKEELMAAIGIPGERITIIPHGNYFHAIDRIPGQSDARQRLGLPQDAKILLFFGHIKEVKGLDLLLRALPGVLKAHPNVLLLIAGKTWKIDFSLYQEMISELGIGDHCLIHGGFIPPEEAPFYFSAADLVVLPYRRIYQSGVLLMALSYGKAVLASDLEGMKEVITDGETGHLFSSGDADALKNRLIEVLADPAGLRLVAERSQGRIREDHDWGIIGRKTADCYRALLVKA